MSQAAYALSHGRSLWQLKEALKYARIAKDTSKDQQVLEHHDMVKAKHDEVVEQKKREKEAAENAQPAQTEAPESTEANTDQNDSQT